MVRLWWLEAAATLGFEEEGEVKSVRRVSEIHKPNLISL